MKKSLISILSVSSLLLLSACGGGDDSPASATPPTTQIDFPIRTGYTNYLTSTGSSSFKIAGRYDEAGGSTPIAGSGTETWGALTAATFEGKPAQRKTLTVLGSMSISGVSAPLSQTIYTYYDSNYNPLGQTGDDYMVVTSSTPIPATVKINDTGSLYTANLYTTSSKTQLLGTATSSYVVQAESPTTALFVVVGAQKDTNGKTTFQGTATYRITTTGALTKIEEKGVLNGSNPTSITTMTMTY